MKKLTLIFSICLMSILSAQAQSKHESVLKLINLMQQDAMVDKMFEGMSSSFSQQIQSQAKDSAAQVKAKAMMDAMFGSIKGITKKLINEDMVALYEKYFTEADIQSYIRFYQSTSGKKMITVMPDMQKDIMNIMMTKYIPELKTTMEKKEKELKEAEKK